MIRSMTGSIVKAMREYIHIRSSTTRDIYQELLPQIRGLIEGEPDRVANLSNVSAALKMALPKISWVGFYLWDGSELVLGPFQGKPACVRIRPGQGVCGTSFQRRETLVVPDVDQFPGHIACDPDSRSEIVLPLVDGPETYGVLDVDSAQVSAFDTIDQQYLQQIVLLVLPYFRKSR